ncbi:MAG: hypothetical protein ABW171_13985 [Steroidobacter sp.]
MVRAFILGLSLALFSSTVLAQTPLPPEFAACSRIQKNGERLACYDRAVSYLSQPGERQSAAPTPETSFGLQAEAPKAPAAETPEGDAKAENVSSVTAHVAEVSTDREGKRAITLDNGHTWRELAKSTSGLLKVGDEITVKRAAFGSFMMSIPNGPPLRVRRVK